MKLLQVFLYFFLFAIFNASLVSAVENQVQIPDFPSCVNPTGSLVTTYSSGTHGIVGRLGEFVGSDAVYSVGDFNMIQCFCSANGLGIQTNWWKISSLSQNQIDQLIKLGWIFVPSGTPWGLTASAYMAQNIDYSCLSGGSGGFSGSTPGGAPVCDSLKPQNPALISVTRSGSNATLAWTKVANSTHYTISYGTSPGVYLYGVPNTGDVSSYTIGHLDPSANYFFEVRAVNNCMPSDPSVSGGQILGASTSILGLAATGNSPWLLASFGLGIAFILIGLHLRRYEV